MHTEEGILKKEGSRPLNHGDTVSLTMHSCSCHQQQGQLVETCFLIQ